MHRRTYFLAAVCCTTFAPSAYAISVLTASAAANVRPNVNFLDQSSRLAVVRSSNPRIRSFARAEVEEQTAVANAIVAWTQAVTSDGAAEALGFQSFSPVAANPLDVDALFAGSGETANAIVTGRSVAIQRPKQPGEKATLPAAQDNLKSLESLRGAAFDRLYKSSQIDALLQLSTLYTAYIQHGDDEALRNLAVRQLPGVNKRLADLRRL